MITIQDFCYALMPSSMHNGKGELIIIHAFTKGYTPTQIIETEEKVNEMNHNKEESVSWAEMMAMFDASMWGWDLYLKSLQRYKQIEKEKNENTKIYSLI